ncbi:hypothetical protein MTBUT4_230007 [Magnetospirillum sp. UT-4]|nr:hypothetical protein MTBUT4_230007 [Magnetospirillum sp. UT-4]
MAARRLLRQRRHLGVEGDGEPFRMALRPQLRRHHLDLVPAQEGEAVGKVGIAGLVQGAGADPDQGGHLVPPQPRHGVRYREAGGRERFRRRHGKKNPPDWTPPRPGTEARYCAPGQRRRKEETMIAHRPQANASVTADLPNAEDLECLILRLRELLLSLDGTDEKRYIRTHGQGAAASRRRNRRSTW